MSIEHALLDSLTLRKMAERAGVTEAQARVLAAAMFELPAQQLMRILHGAAVRCARAKPLSSSKRTT